MVSDAHLDGQIARTSAARGGIEKVIRVIDRFLRDMASKGPFQRLLSNEPEIALRILTSKHGPVEQGIADVVERQLFQVSQTERIGFTVGAEASPGRTWV